MPGLAPFGRKPRRVALAAAYALLLALAALSLADLEVPLAPAAVPAMAAPGRPATVPPVDTRTLAGMMLQRWLDLAGAAGLRTLLDLAIPGLAPAAAVRGSFLETGPAAQQGFISYVLGSASAVRLDQPVAILSAQLPGLRTVPAASAGPIQIVPELPDEGESATPPTAPGPALSPPDPELDPAARPEEGPLVAVYHTHARESFLPWVRQVSTAAAARIQAEEAFSDDHEFTVVRVGQELAGILAQQHRIPTVHSRRVHDAGGRLGAYVQSAATIERLLREYPSLRVLIDLHRDSPRRNVTYTRVRGQGAARILLVIGTNRLLEHRNWRANHAFATRLHHAMEEMYPGLSRGVMVTDSRYNQHFLPHAVLVEIGGVDNTQPEVMASARMFAAVLAAVMRQDDELGPMMRPVEAPR